LGLGSFIQGDVRGGATTLLSYGTAIGLINWELTLSYNDTPAGIPRTLWLGIAGFAVAYGFIRLAVYDKSRALAEFMDGITIAAASDEQWGAAVRVSRTIRF
jgi:hypothetical protein